MTIVVQYLFENVYTHKLHVSKHSDIMAAAVHSQSAQCNFGLSPVACALNGFQSKAMSPMPCQLGFGHLACALCPGGWQAPHLEQQQQHVSGVAENPHLEQLRMK